MTTPSWQLLFVALVLQLLLLSPLVPALVSAAPEALISSEQRLEDLVGDAPDAFREEKKNLVTGDNQNIDIHKTFGKNVENLYRMPLGGMTNLHHPTSCSRKRNCEPRWLEVRQMVNIFLEQPFNSDTPENRQAMEKTINGMIGRRWDLSNCDCTCGVCHTFLQECPLGHLVTKWMSFFGTTAAFRALIVYGNVLHKTDLNEKNGFVKRIGSTSSGANSDSEADSEQDAASSDQEINSSSDVDTSNEDRLKEFDIVEDYGSNILFMIRGNWGSYNLMQSGWPLYDILLRLSHQLKQDNYPVEDFIRQSQAEKIDFETWNAVNNADTTQRLIIAELAHRNAPVLRRYEKPTWFCCFPTSYERVRQEIHVLKYNLRLIQFEKISLGWFSFLSDAWVSLGFGELSVGSSRTTATRSGAATVVTSTAGRTTSSKRASKLPSSATDLLKQEAIKQYKSFENYVLHARSELSREFFLDSSNYTQISPIPTFFEHHKALLQSHPFAKRVLDLDQFTILREDPVELDVSVVEDEDVTSKGSGTSSDSDSEPPAIQQSADHDRERKTILEKNRFGTSAAHFHDSRGVEFQVSHFSDGPRIVHEPGNVIWRLNLAHDKQKLPGFVDAGKLIRENKLTSKFFDSHFASETTSSDAEVTPEEDSPDQITGEQEKRVINQESFISPTQLNRMQNHIRHVTKYLMPSCSLQQAVALAEYLVEVVLQVNLTAVSDSGDNIFQIPGTPEPEHMEHTTSGAFDQNRDDANPPRSKIDRTYKHACQSGSSQGLPEEVLESESTTTTQHWTHTLFKKYHNDKTFEEIHRRTYSDWLREKVKIPSWTELIINRLNKERGDFWTDSAATFSEEDIDWAGNGSVEESKNEAGAPGAAPNAVPVAVDTTPKPDHFPDIKFVLHDEDAVERTTDPKNKPTILFRLSEQQLTDLKLRLEVFLHTTLTDIDMLLHTWARWQRKGFFGALLALPEARRLLKGLSIIQRSLMQEFYCRKKDEDGKAVGYQGEWNVEASVINLMSGGLGLDLREEQKRIKEKVKNQGQGRNSRVAMSGADVVATSSTTTTTTTQVFIEGGIVKGMFKDGITTVFADGTRQKITVDRQLLSVDNSKIFARKVSKRFAFTSVMFDNKEVETYINALRTLARSVYRVHKGKYRFIILSNEKLSNETEEKLLFGTHLRDGRGAAQQATKPPRAGDDEPPQQRPTTTRNSLSRRSGDYNLEVRRVLESELPVKAPTFGKEPEPNSDGKIEWWYERKTTPTAVGFYRWKLTEFEKVIFLDADMLLTRPIDELFQINAPLAIGVTPFATFRLFADMNRFPYLNIGVMVLTPNEKFFNQLMYALSDFGKHSPIIRDDRLSHLFEKGLQQPWLDNFLVRNQVRLGYVRFEPLGTEGDEGARRRRKHFYHSMTELDSTREQDESGVLYEQELPDGFVADRQLEQVQEQTPVSSNAVQQEVHLPPKGDEDGTTSTVAEEADAPEVDDSSDSNQIPLTFVGCDEHFATRWEHGELLGRGALLKPDTVILSLKSNASLALDEKNRQQAQATQQPVNPAYVPPTDANSIQRVYFTTNGKSIENVRYDLDRLGYKDHLLLPYHCVLPMEYNFFVEYKTGTQLLDMTWNEYYGPMDTSESDKDELNTEFKYQYHLKNEFAPFTRFNVTRDLVAFTQMSLPPKVLHWAGENRKPWERPHVLVRSLMDQLWWDEFEAMVEESK
ncbi:unnamed protein product [Amoebophrya sp. A120]|nr:unnamed protein product [Amoebophrya sp. A120]|eukprot:GSA120T00025714001.1